MLMSLGRLLADREMRVGVLRASLRALSSKENPPKKYTHVALAYLTYSRASVSPQMKCVTDGSRRSRPRELHRRPCELHQTPGITAKCQGTQVRRVRQAVNRTLATNGTFSRSMTPNGATCVPDRGRTVCQVSHGDGNAWPVGNQTSVCNLQEILEQTVHVPEWRAAILNHNQ
jgi:hypothetical protein